MKGEINCMRASDKQIKTTACAWTDTDTGETRILPAQLSAGDDVIAVGERLAPDGGSDLAQQPGAVLTGFTPNTASGLGRSWTFRNHNGCCKRQFVLFVYLYLFLPASPVQQVTFDSEPNTITLPHFSECWPNMETCVNYQLLIGSSSVRTPPEWVWASALLSSFAASRATQLKPSCGFSDFSCRGNGRDWQAFPPITIEHLPVGGMRLSLNNIWPIRDDQLIN